MQIWVGYIPSLTQLKLEIAEEVREEHPRRILLAQELFDRVNYEYYSRLDALAQKLYLYVKGILESKESEEMLNHLTQENASLKEQLAELRKRELAYLSNAKGAIPHSVYASYQRERALLERNIHYLREQAAMYGPLDTPLRIRNEIEAHEKLINEIDAHIARSKASKTDWI